MRAPNRFSIVSLVCLLALASQCVCVLALDDTAKSTIRLVSATEPVREDPAPKPTPQVDVPVVEQPSTPTQAPQADDQSSGNLVPAPPRPQVQSQRTGLSRTPANLYADASARAALNQMPGPARVQGAPGLPQTRRGPKPFQSLTSEPTISPYLYLSSTNPNVSPVTNYYAFVRPQLDQLEASRQQQREIQQLRSQVQKMSSAGGGSHQSANMNSAARYMNTAQFYPAYQR